MQGADRPVLTLLKDETRRSPLIALKELVGIIELMEREIFLLPLVAGKW